MNKVDGCVQKNENRSTFVRLYETPLQIDQGAQRKARYIESDRRENEK